MEELGRSGEDLKEELGLSGEDLETVWMSELSYCHVLLKVHPTRSLVLPALSMGNYSPEETLFSVVSSMPETVWYLVGTQ